MNYPYTCHNCGTEFDLLTDDQLEIFEASGQPIPQRVKTRCPGCYAAGYTSVDQMVYTVDTQTLTHYVPATP